MMGLGLSDQGSALENLSINEAVAPRVFGSAGKSFD